MCLRIRLVGSAGFDSGLFDALSALVDCAICFGCCLPDGSFDLLLFDVIVCCGGLVVWCSGVCCLTVAWIVCVLIVLVLRYLVVCMLV